MYVVWGFVIIIIIIVIIIIAKICVVK